jgi:hypothetical protein
MSSTWSDNNNVRKRGWCITTMSTSKVINVEHWHQRLPTLTPDTTPDPLQKSVPCAFRETILAHRGLVAKGHWPMWHPWHFLFPRKAIARNFFNDHTSKAKIIISFQWWVNHGQVLMAYIQLLNLCRVHEDVHA